jgi:hypothetical protein
VPRPCRLCQPSLRILKTTHLVVLGNPASSASILLFPSLVLWQGEEDLFLLALVNLDDGRDELDQKVGNAQEGREEVVEEIDDQPFDVGPVMILCRMKSIKLE